MKLSPEIKQKWVEALRSGKYKQGKGKLYDKDTNSYCCLGVLCHIQGIDKDNINCIAAPDITITRDIQYVSKENGGTLALMNDGDNEKAYSFNKIADYIEQNEEI